MMIDKTIEFKKMQPQISYRYFLYKFDPVKEKKLYIIHISSEDLVKVANAPFFFEAQDEATENLLKSDPDINNTNSILYTFYEFKRGIKFIPDVRLFSKSHTFRAHVENNIQLGGVAVIVPPKGLIKYRSAIKQVASFFDPSSNIDLVSSIDEAYKAIESFN